MGYLQNFEFGAKKPLDPKFGLGVQKASKVIAGVQTSQLMSILGDFVRKLQIFEFGAKGPLDPQFTKSP